MPIPSNLTTITVTGEFLDSNGNPLLGTVSFAPPVDIYDAGGSAIISRVPYVATLSPSTGAFSITLPCTDNAAMSPTNWGYTVTINLTALTSGPYPYTGVAIPHTLGTSVDLTQLLPPTVAPVISPNVYGVLSGPNLWAGTNTFTSAIVAPNITDLINVKGSPYLAAGNGTTDDTAAINSALTAGAGGTVYVPAGTYKTTSPLIIHSNTLLLCSRDAVFNLASGSQCNMLQNASVTAQRTITDGAITTGTSLLNSPSQAAWTSADVGRSVTIAGALDGSKPLTATITALNSATQVQINATAGATVSAASVSVYNRDSNIEVRGGTWNRGNNGWTSATSSPGLYTIRIEHADTWSVHDVTLSTTNKGYELACGDVTNFTIRNITGNTANTITNTDLVNVHGPAQYGTIDSIFGTCGDDFVSIHSLDGDGNLQNVVGNITDIVVSNLFPNQVGQAAFKVHAGSTTVCSSITARGIHGSSLAGGVHLQDYVTPTSTSILDDILVEDVDVTTSANVGLVNIYCNNASGQITLKDLVWRYNTSFPSVVYVMPGTTLGQLTVKGMVIEQGNNVRGILVGGSSGSATTVGAIILDDLVETSNAATVVTGVQIDSTFVTVKNVTVRGATCFKDTNAQQALVYCKGNLDTVTIDNAYLTGGGIALGTTSAASALKAVLSNITLEGAYQLAQVASTVDLSVTNLDVVSTNQSNLIFVTGASAVLSVRGRGLINPTSVGCFSRDLTQTPRIVHREMRVDVAQCANNLGDEAYNTNSASAALGPVLADGTWWYPAIPKPTAGAIISGQYSLPDGGQPSSSTTFSSGELRVYPVYIGPGAAIERIWAEVTVVGDATSTVRLGIYADTGGFLPGALVLDAGTINGNSATVQEITLGANLSLAPGWYWFGGACVYTTTAPTVRTLTASNPVQFPLGTALPAAGTNAVGVRMTGVTGALPSTFTVGGIAGSAPRIGVKGH